MFEPSTVPLEWLGTTHTLVFQTEVIGKFLILTVNKGETSQRLTVKLQNTTHVQDVLAAWKAQGNNWEELRCQEGFNFLAIRVLWIEGKCLQWGAFHTNGFPSDTFDFTPMTKEIWAAALAAQANR